MSQVLGPNNKMELLVGLNTARIPENYTCRFRLRIQRRPTQRLRKDYLKEGLSSLLGLCLECLAVKRKNMNFKEFKRLSRGMNRSFTKVYTVHRI